MKLSAITSRSAEKDYVDLYFILKKIPLRELLDACSAKFKILDRNLILKSLVYFDDIHSEHILFKRGSDVALDTIKDYLRKIVKEYFKII